MLTTILLFAGIGTPELMVIMFAILLLFGGKKLPELARGLGKGIREFKDASEGVKREIHRNINSVQEDLDVDLDSKPATAQTTQKDTEQSQINS
ncbi:twin-arginine translocase TatA/TatE family subunit [Arcticibacter sp. MXS-1]|uniref:twin-arginine translocase TatA/TatE family subunit n=1 Tax=Arcticibacter sp. MXS-1 TaxID=3341726 RepID=UPI0035A8A29B